MIGTHYREPKALRMAHEMEASRRRRSEQLAGERLAHESSVAEALARARAAQRRHDFEVREDRWAAPGVDRLESSA